MSDHDFLSAATPAADALELESFSGQEELSSPFLYTLQFLSKDRKLDFKKLMGKAVTITIVLPDKSKRYICGLVTRFVESGYDPKHTLYVAELRPWLWLLTLHADNRIFQNKSVPEIIEEVFSDLGLKDFKKSLKGTYAKREYCVQYQESSFDFVSRLMEDEGIFYYFEHSDGKHLMVLADDSDGYATCTGSAEVEMGLNDTPNCLRDCSFEETLVTTGYALTDYNFEIPSTDLFVKTGGGSPALVVYDHPGNYAKKNEGEKLVKLRIEAMEHAQKVLRASSNCRGFVAGGKFKLTKHDRADLNQEYVIRSVSHRADRGNYSNTLEALPASVVFRPMRRTRRQVAIGSQTAVVVGKSGEEIWTDKYGRVKVQFPWDRKGKKDENSSCWVRVTQHWAGKGYGTFFLPRIGQEVVITFIDGNPDRPLITGAVYNAEQTVPYPLPDNQTKSTTKSRTSKGGGGFNEIRLEDKKDSEEIYIHAQKDMNIEVKHDRTAKIDNDCKTDIKNDRSAKIDNNDKTVVKKNREVEVTEGDELLTVKKGNRTISVDKGDEKHSVKGKRTVSVDKDEKHANKAKFSHTVDKDYILTVKGNLTIEVDGDIKIKSKKGIKAEAAAAVDLKAGADMKLKAGANMKQEGAVNFDLKAGVGMKLEGVNIDVKASAMAKLEGGAMAAIKGGLVKLN
ncbi:MAG: type VI secretion system tip protein VgrG [Myxococcales bacterium]|nr:type VI secretion system tip protein VgrG [Myxococcales bacterium]